MPRILFAPMFAAAATILLSACTGSEESSVDSPTPQPAPVTASDLPNLVLDVSEVNVDGTTLPLDPEDTGPQLWEDQIDGVDSEWTAETLRKYNWQAAYYQDFGTGAQDSPVFNASVGVDLHDTGENASGALAEMISHVTAQEGQTIEDVTLESVEVFDVAEFGAKGMKWTVRSSDGRVLYLTNIDFVRGSVIVDVGTGSFDERDLVPATMDLVRQVEARLAAAGLT